MIPVRVPTRAHEHGHTAILQQRLYAIVCAVETALQVLRQAIPAKEDYASAEHFHAAYAQYRTREEHLLAVKYSCAAEMLWLDKSVTDKPHEETVKGQDT